MKTRVVERTYPNGTIRFVIQQRKFFRWVDAKKMTFGDAKVNTIFTTKKSAFINQENFTGKKPSDQVVES